MAKVIRMHRGDSESKAALEHRGGSEGKAALAHAEGSEGKAAQLTPEDVVIDAMGAYDSLARHAIMNSRAGGLSKTQTDILMRLACFGECSMSVLADDLAVSKEHVTRAVSALIDRGLADKRRSSENFRLVKATLTDKGEALALSIRQASTERLKERLASISPADREVLFEASKQAASVIRKIMF